VTNVLFSGDQMTAEVYEISGRLRDQLPDEFRLCLEIGTNARWHSVVVELRSGQLVDPSWSS
jgi:hypothetical protein